MRNRVQPKGTELEQQLYEALAIVIDGINFPFEVTKGGMTIIRFSAEQVDEIRTAYELFPLIHGQRLSRGDYVEIKPGEVTHD